MQVNDTILTQICTNPIQQQQQQQKNELKKHHIYLIYLIYLVKDLRLILLQK